MSCVPLSRRAGVMQLMAKAYLTWQDPRYLDSCLRSGQLVWECGLLRKGPGICHGIGGSGYALLLLYRLTADLRWLHRARQFAEFMFTDEFKQARTPDCPYSLFEGLAGTACFLAGPAGAARGRLPPQAGGCCMLPLPCSASPTRLTKRGAGIGKMVDHISLYVRILS
ncbi:hypothetical protein HPB48_008838 [Haemaphysalis longicornis]|uniref:Uncharacterized protein n=1 Tax=Haemaphysalis longicornis TaxID=44386 RepID=A0A9J6H3E8_HAELO|nr:hypothetical protein HPB48_008838 [Haemaphysalis longicornis]